MADTSGTVDEGARYSSKREAKRKSQSDRNWRSSVPRCKLTCDEESAQGSKVQESPTQFRWIDWNEDHIAEHGVEPEEVETVVENAKPRFPRKIGDEKWLVIGRAEGE